MVKKLKYRIAYLLNRIPGVCWANLVLWVEFGKPLRECRMDTFCHHDFKQCGICYCGKLNDGRFKAVSDGAEVQS